MDARCTKCGSGKVIPLVDIQDQGQYSDGSLRAWVGFTNPEAWMFKGSVYARLRATICGQCGYTELTAADPAALYEAYLKTRSQAEGTA
jgi:predicted nucleic-acid-binding Zn-ribbon protein